ncbi:hypothetical protein [Frigidibacter mobilis]|uniref:Uncharacterized protein n=1 Tax=Frigidibacter mobilis TaxID=1335048 RepID=A0A165SJV6_9RHOB|nr:hypothetical protein [Frigidibacter mobilis]AMY68769.1 hypothetical protein AKL17_1516 [Frigidibacter mobilis]
MQSIPLVLVLLLAACTESEPAASDTAAGNPPSARPMDEVPAKQLLANGAREYRFGNGCVIVLQARQAVMSRENAACELYQRDIALLYAAGD